MRTLLIKLLWPAILLAAASPAADWLETVAPAQKVVAEFAAPFALGVALLLAFRFNRGRVFFTLLTLLAAYTAFWQLPGASRHEYLVLFGTTAIALPSLMAVFAFMGEHGILSRGGMIRFALVVLPVGYTMAALALPASVPVAWLDARFLHLQLLEATALTRPGAITLVAALLLVNGRLFLRPGAESAALFGSLLAVVPILHAGEFTMDTVAFVTAAAVMVGTAVIQESWTMAYVDELTQLPGRRALREATARLGNRFAVGMLDIDHFKKFNDTHGHDTGDEVLRMVAAKLARVPGSARAFRYGGEEFCVLFPGRNRDEARDTLDALRRSIADKPFELRRGERRHDGKGGKSRSRTVEVTISAGVADSTSVEGGPDAVIRGADKALYRAKRRGRNRVSR